MFCARAFCGEEGSRENSKFSIVFYLGYQRWRKAREAIDAQRRIEFSFHYALMYTGIRGVVLVVVVVACAIFYLSKTRSIFAFIFIVVVVVVVSWYYYSRR